MAAKVRRAVSQAVVVVEALCGGQKVTTAAENRGAEERLCPLLLLLLLLLLSAVLRAVSSIRSISVLLWAKMEQDEASSRNSSSQPTETATNDSQIRRRWRQGRGG